MNAWMKAGAVLVTLGGLSVAMPAVQAQGDPSIDACTQYAEADIVFENAEVEAEAVYETAKQEAGAVFESAMEILFEEAKAEAAYKVSAEKEEVLNDVAMQLVFANAEYAAAVRKGDAIYEAAVKEAEAVFESSLDKAENAIISTYRAAYAEDGGRQSDAWEVMEKLISSHRDRCTELFGL